MIWKWQTKVKKYIYMCPMKLEMKLIAGMRSAKDKNRSLQTDLNLHITNYKSCILHNIVMKHWWWAQSPCCSLCLGSILLFQQISLHLHQPVSLCLSLSGICLSIPQDEQHVCDPCWGAGSQRRTAGRGRGVVAPAGLSRIPLRPFLQR